MNLGLASAVAFFSFFSLILLLVAFNMILNHNKILAIQIVEPSIYDLAIIYNIRAIYPK